ncbi:MAG: hypothetical protein KC501_20220 [Myxococcales bacterium]|nr:hypothetical protein [Myxococcales bacterium]
MSTTSDTKLSIYNDTAQEVEVYVTFAAGNHRNECCPEPVGVEHFPFLDRTHALQGKLVLGAGKVQELDPGGKCLSGNVSFYIPPQCPVPGADFHHGETGTNIAEFTLNPKKPCMEAFDISCVNGVNCYMAIKVDPKEGWTYGPDNEPIDSIYNRALQENSGNPGVYPVNCTDCVRLVGRPPCPSLPVGPAQKSRICNVQRKGRGGTVQIVLLPQMPA